jgi:hypothetical protein
VATTFPTKAKSMKIPTGPKTLAGMPTTPPTTMAIPLTPMKVKKGEDDDDGDSDDDEGSADDGQVDLTAQVEVTIDGEAKKVPLKEALEGYIRTQTFHKRLNEVNELKKTVETEAAGVAQARDVYGNMLTALKEQLDSLTPEEPNWDAEFAKDPISASRLQHQWGKYKEQRAAIEGERQRVQQEQQKENIKKLNAYAAAERQKCWSAVPSGRTRRSGPKTARP